MGKTGRTPSCLCGECAKCKQREKSRLWYASLTVEERRARRAKLDPTRVAAHEHARYERHKEKRLAKNAAWLKAHPEKPIEYAKASRNRFPEKARARDGVKVALRRGLLVKQPCEVGIDCKGRIEAHHDDYSKPLDVRWLCTKHHAEHHSRRIEVAA